MPQFKICKNELKLVLENKNYKTENIYKKERNRKRERPYLATAHQAKAHASPA
jgi:hypothetical protein